MAKLETVTGVAPSSWAVYFINGDVSDLTDEDRQHADAFAAWLTGGKGSIVDCTDAGFRWRHDASDFGALASDCQEYSALIEVA